MQTRDGQLSFDTASTLGDITVFGFQGEYGCESQT